MNLGTHINKDLVGNLIILLTERCKPLFHTKLMKLLFFIDQEATKTKGTPITWLDYKAWKLGPVAPELYFSKNRGYNIYHQFAIFESIGANNACIVKPVKPFDDSEFSDWDMEIIEKTIEKYGKLNTKELVHLTHEEGSLWDKAVKQSGVKFSQNNMTSDISLDFLELIDDDDYKKSIYYSTLENLELKSTFSKYQSFIINASGWIGN